MSFQTYAVRISVFWHTQNKIFISVFFVYKMNAGQWVAMQCIPVRKRSPNIPTPSLKPKRTHNLSLKLEGNDVEEPNPSCKTLH